MPLSSSMCSAYLCYDWYCRCLSNNVCYCSNRLHSIYSACCESIFFFILIFYIGSEVDFFGRLSKFLPFRIIILFMLDVLLYVTQLFLINASRLKYSILLYRVMFLSFYSVACIDTINNSKYVFWKTGRLTKRVSEECPYSLDRSRRFPLHQEIIIYLSCTFHIHLYVTLYILHVDSIKTCPNLYFLSCLDPRRMLHIKYVSGCQFVGYIFFFGFCIDILFIKRQVKSKSLKISRRVS